MLNSINVSALLDPSQELSLDDLDLVLGGGSNAVSATGAGDDQQQSQPYDGRSHNTQENNSQANAWNLSATPPTPAAPPNLSPANVSVGVTLDLTPAATHATDAGLNSRTFHEVDGFGAHIVHAIDNFFFGPSAPPPTPPSGGGGGAEGGGGTGGTAG